MKMRALAVLLSLLSILLVGEARAETRVALVLGNSAYKNVAPRVNAVGDAHAVAALLKSVGFDVIEASDVTREQLSERLGQFAGKADEADIALFFYAGQSISLSGMNYILPVEADLSSEMDVKLGAAVPLNKVFDGAMGHARIKMVLFDASRFNPFSRSNPAVSQIAANGETLTAFAADPGQGGEEGPKGGHSPFTQALLENIAVPGVGIQQAMTKVRARVVQLTEKRQMPWGSDNLMRAVYLNPEPAK
jgi:uncharacterized caspase-like protein